MPKDNYIISLKGVYDNKPRTRRANYAIREIYRFLKKHTRKNKDSIIISTEVNNFIWKNSIQRPPRKIEISLKFKDNEVFVFLKDSQNFKDFGKSEKTKDAKDSKAKAAKEEPKAEAVKDESKAKVAKEEPKAEAVKDESKAKAVK